MKHFFHSSLLILMFWGFIIPMSLPVQAAIISIAPSQTQLNVGDTLFVDLSIALDANEILSAFDINLNFDDSAFSFVSISFVDPVTSQNQLDLPDIDSFGFLSGASDLGGLLDVFAVSGNLDTVLQSNQASTFVFASFEFLAVAALDNTIFALNINNPYPAFLGADLTDLAISFEPNVTSVRISSPIPEPSVFWLLLAGWLTVIFRSRQAIPQLAAFSH